MALRAGPSDQGGLRVCHTLRQGAGQLACVARRLSAHQVIGLDGRGAFVDGEDLGVPQVLGSARFLDEAHAAVHLDAQARHFQAHLGGQTLHQGHQELVERLVLAPHRLVRMGMGGVESAGSHQRHGTAAFGMRPHGHQHAAYIRVVDDGCRRMR